MRPTLLTILGTTTAVLVGGAVIGVLVRPSTMLIEEAAMATTTSAPLPLPRESVDVSFPGFAAPADEEAPAAGRSVDQAAPMVPIPAPEPVAEARDAPGSRGEPEVLGSVDVADAALARLNIDWQALLPGWRMQFPGPRRGFRGATYPQERLIQIYVRPGQSVDDVAHVIGHELGHAVDVTYFDTAERAAFHVLRGRSADSSWFVADGQTDFASGAGDWAETFSWVVTGGAGDWGSELGDPPTAIQAMGVRELVR